MQYWSHQAQIKLVAGSPKGMSGVWRVQPHTCGHVPFQPCFQWSSCIVHGKANEDHKVGKQKEEPRSQKDGWLTLDLEIPNWLLNSISRNQEIGTITSLLQRTKTYP